MCVTKKYVERVFSSRKSITVQDSPDGNGPPGTRPDLQQEPLNLGRIGIHQLESTGIKLAKSFSEDHLDHLGRIIS